MIHLMSPCTWSKLTRLIIESININWLVEQLMLGWGIVGVNHVSTLARSVDLPGPSLRRKHIYIVLRKKEIKEATGLGYSNGPCWAIICAAPRYWTSEILRVHYFIDKRWHNKLIIGFRIFSYRYWLISIVPSRLIWCRIGTVFHYEKAVSV